MYRVHCLFGDFNKTRRDETRRDETRRDETRRDETRRDETRRDETRRDETRHLRFLVTYPRRHGQLMVNCFVQEHKRTSRIELTTLAWVKRPTRYHSATLQRQLKADNPLFDWLRNGVISNNF